MNIKAILKEKGVTLEELAIRIANEMGIEEVPTKSAISQTINGNPTRKKLELIAKVLGCGVGDFFRDDVTCTHQTSSFTCPKCGAKLSIKIEEVE